MRIIAGEWKGHRLIAPKGKGIRPTADMVREAMFDVLSARVPGARVLDLFAGTGALGLEALSRGATHVTWVDQEPRSIDGIHENLEKLKALRSCCEVLNMPAAAALRRFAKTERQFDLIFVDPPYESGLYEETLLAMAMSRVLAPDGIVAVEHARRYQVAANYGDLLQFKDRRYGETCVAWFRRGVRETEPAEAAGGEGNPEEVS